MKHRKFTDFPNADAAKRYLRELQGKISDMQRKLDHARYKAKAFKKFADPDWLHRITVALDCHKQEAALLSASIVEHDRIVKRKTADFYWHFFNAAKRQLTSQQFEDIDKQAAWEVKNG